MLKNKGKKIIFGLTAFSMLAAGQAYADGFVSTATLKYGDPKAYGEFMTITKNLKVFGRNTGPNTMLAAAKRNVILTPDPLYGNFNLAPGTSDTSYTEVPHSTYYALARPAYENGHTSGAVSISNYK